MDTLEAYDGTVDFLRKLSLDEDALTKAIIGTMGDIDAYQLPDAKGNAAFSRYLLGVTDEERQERREQVLGTTEKDFRWVKQYVSDSVVDEGALLAAPL